MPPIKLRETIRNLGIDLPDSSQCVLRQVLFLHHHYHNLHLQMWCHHIVMSWLSWPLLQHTHHQYLQANYTVTVPVTAHHHHHHHHHHFRIHSTLKQLVILPPISVSFSFSANPASNRRPPCLLGFMLSMMMVMMILMTEVMIKVMMVMMKVMMMVLKVVIMIVMVEVML